MHLNCFRETIPDVPIMALTATAVPRVQTDILTALLMRQDTYKAQQTFDRPNLGLSPSAHCAHCAHCTHCALLTALSLLTVLCSLRH